jgi:anaerobic selenocysteine-containing dehydrogenase
MDINRREFLKLIGGGGAAAVIFSACGVPEEELYFQSPNKLPEDQVTGIDNWYATLGSNGEGLAIRIMEGRAKKVEGNTDYPVNIGSHSISSEAELQMLYHPDRIQAPLVRKEGTNRGAEKWEEISWTDAYKRIAFQLDRLGKSKSSVVSKPLRGRAGSVLSAFANEMGNKEIIFTAFDDSNVLSALQKITGSYNMPKFDIAHSDLLLNFGMDMFNSNHSEAMFGRLYGQFRDAPRGTLYQIESRLSLTATNADEWIYCKPGSQGLIASSIAYVLISKNMIKTDLAKKLNIQDLKQYSPENVSSITGMSEEKIEYLAKKLSEAKHPLIIGGDEASASSNGTSSVEAIYALNVLLGNINKEGGIIINPDSPLDDLGGSRFEGNYKKTLDLVSNIKSGSVNSLFINDIDLNYYLPKSLDFKSALSKLELIVSFNSFVDDTSKYADIILPLNTQFESWGNDVPSIGPGYQVVGFQQPVVKSQFSHKGKYSGTKDLSDIIIELSDEIGVKNKYSGKKMKDILMEDAQVLWKLNRGSITAADFKSFWNGVLSRGGWWDINSKVKNNVQSNMTNWPKVQTLKFSNVSGKDSFHLVPFRTKVGDGSFAKSPWLQGLTDPLTTIAWETWVEINYDLAKKMKIKEGDIIEISNSNNESIKAAAYPNPSVSPEVITVPVGGGQESGSYTKNVGSNVYSILDVQLDDNIGTHAWAATKVKIRNTGNNIAIPKFEGRFEELKRDPHNHVIKVTTSDSDDNDHH